MQSYSISRAEGAERVPSAREPEPIFNRQLIWGFRRFVRGRIARPKGKWGDVNREITQNFARTNFNGTRQIPFGWGRRLFPIRKFQLGKFQQPWEFSLRKFNLGNFSCGNFLVLISHLISLIS